MLILFFVVLLIVLLTAYAAFRGDVTSPSLILVFLFLIGTFFSIVGNFWWNEVFFPFTFIVLLVGIVCVVVGELYGRSLFDVFYKNKYIFAPPLFYIKSSRIIVLLAAQLIVAFLYYKRLNAMIESIGFTGEFFLRYSRMATIDYGLKLGSFFTFFLWVATSGSYASTYFFIASFFKKNIVTRFGKVLLLLSIFVGVFVFVLGAAKFGLLQLMTIALFTYVYYSTKTFAQGRLFLLARVLVFVVIALVCINTLTFFRLENTTKNVVDTLCIYAGSSIMGLNSWLQTDSYSIFFGEETFWGVRKMLNIIIPSIETTKQFDEFTHFFNGSSTNIYTAYRAFFSDFGWMGLILISFLIGMFYSIFYCYVRRSNKDLFIVVYAFLFFYMAYMLFAPVVTTSILTTSRMMGLLWLVVISRFLVKIE